MIEYATSEEIIMKIEELYIEGDEPTQEIIELCGQVAKDDEDCWGTGIVEETDIDGDRNEYSNVLGICGCITNRFEN